MSLSRSSAATAILRTLSRTSLPQQPKICQQCLVNPASCQISSMAAAVSAASHGSGQAASRRLQSTSSTSSRVTTGATPSPVPPIIQQVDNSTGSSTTEEATNATTSNVSSPSAAVTREKPTFKSLPTLEDLNGLKSRRLVAPHEAEPASSAIVGMYTRRFKNLYFRVNRAFNKEQLAHLARLANIGDHIDGIRRKADLIKKIMTLYWDLTDPAQYALKESERKKLESQEPYDITEDVAVNERELFFLLGKGRTADLLQQLTYKTQVKASVRGHPSVLRLTGSPAQVEAVRGEWARLKQGISTDVLDTNLLKRLRPDLYKSLSIVSDAFVASESKSLKRVQVSYRTRQKAAVGKVEAGLRYLRLQHSTILKSPRFAFLDNQNKDNVYLPIVPQSPLPWDLVALSPMNLTRYTSMSPQGSARSLYRAGWNESETREEDLQSALLDPLTAAKGDLKVKASFGHMLRLNSQQSLHVERTTPGDWSTKPFDVFVPATPDGIANRFNINLRRYDPRYLEEHISNLKISTKRLRRLVYIPKDITTSFKYLQFERPMLLRNQALPSDQLNPWTGEYSQRNFVHIAVPHNLNDLRLEASKSESLPSEILQILQPINIDAPPISFTWENEVYYIVEDARIQEIAFLSGTPEAFNANPDLLQPVLERRTDFLFPPYKRSTAFELRSQRSEKVDEVLPLILQTLHDIPTTSGMSP